MPGLLESCNEHFGTNNLYKLLGIKKTASEAEGEVVSELIPKLRFHYISLHWVSDYLPVSLNQERF